MVEFTTTATCRPDILRQTYASFVENLRGVDLGQCRLWLNIDPLPSSRYAAATLAAAREYFADVRVNVPTRANFAQAVKWCWNQPTEPVFFHLEDDWLLLEPVEFDALHDALLPEVSCVNLRAYPFVLRRPKLFLSPGLWRTDRAKVAASVLVPDENPEWRLWSHAKGHVSMMHPEPTDRIVLQDIGRDWLEMSGMRKNQPSKFTSWEMV